MMKALITGAYGFAASYLTKLLLDKGIEVYGIVRENSNNFRHEKLGIRDRVLIYKGDLADRSSLRSIIKEVEPDVIFNLGAHMYVQTSFMMPHVVFETNTLGVLNILEVVKDFDRSIRIIQAGTSEEYGMVSTEECPITENQVLRPMSPYGVSKVAADHLCMIYAKAYGLDVIVTRAFNHAGAYQNRELVIPKFVRQVMNYVFYNKSIEHGNLDAIRDFVHVEDVVRAYYSLMEKELGQNERTLNICSGKGVSMKQIMDTIISVIGERYDNWIKYTDFENNMSKKYFRPNDVPLLEGDNSLIRSVTAWKPENNIRDIVTDICQWIFEEEYIQDLLRQSIRVGYAEDDKD